MKGAKVQSIITVITLHYYISGQGAFCSFAYYQDSRWGGDKTQSPSTITPNFNPAQSRSQLQEIPSALEDMTSVSSPEFPRGRETSRLLSGAAVLGV